MNFNFKKILLGVGISVFVACPFLAHGSEAQAADVQVGRTNFPVTFNTYQVEQGNNKYPLIVYKDITYVPMTYHDARLLGMTTRWDGPNGTLYIDRIRPFDGTKAVSNYKPYQGAAIAGNRAVVNPFKIVVNGKTINNANSKYPILNYGGVTYFPLTWDYGVNTFGWYYHFDGKNGLVLSSNDATIGQKTSQLAVYAPKVTVYSQATNNSKALGIAKAGQIFTFDEVKGDWYRVALAGNTHGYIHKDGVEKNLRKYTSLEDIANPNNNATVKPPVSTNNGVSPTKPAEPVVKPLSKKIEVSGTVVNLRSGPGTNYDIVGGVKIHDMLEVTGQSKDWYQINNHGQKAWIASWLTAAPGTVPHNDVTSEGDSAVSSSGVSTGQTATVSFASRQSLPGQGTVRLDVGSSDVSVVRSTGEEVTLRVSNARVGNLSNLASGLLPFTHMEVIPEGNNVLIKAGVTQGGFFRFTRSNNYFDFTAVARHKNGHKGLAGKVICIDPGHGSYEANGIDYGASNASKTIYEYHVVTPIAMKLKAKLEQAGATVILTRNEGIANISLFGRADMANKNNADAFISIHADSFPADPSVTGSKVFYYDGGARLTAAVQSKQRIELANAIANEVRNVSGRAQVNMANFAVNRENKVPSILLETGFLSNAAEANRLNDPNYQNLLADAVCRGFATYFSR